MGAQEMTRLIAQALKDDQFREALLANPEEAVKAAGYVLSEEEWEAIRNVDLGVSEEELEERVSKFWTVIAPNAIGGFEA